MTTGERIKAARKRAKMTQAALGLELGVSAPMIAQYENGARNPKYETLKKIAEALNRATEEDRKVSGEAKLTWEDLYSGSQEEKLVLIEQGLLDILPKLKSAAEAARKQREEWEERWLRLDTDEDRITYYYSLLNEEGRRVAADRVQELSEIPKYRETPEEK